MLPTIFLSYARKDDEPFVRRLHGDLTKAGFDVWFDRDDMRARGLTFIDEIKHAISERDRLVFIVGPKAVASPYVRMEWEHALASDKCVNPIVRKNGRKPDGTVVDGYDLMPEELSFFHAEDFRKKKPYARSLANLIRQLSDPPPPLGKLIAVPSMDAIAPHLIRQPERLRALRDALLSDLRSKPVGSENERHRVGLDGMGGIGKSVLACVLAHDRQVRQSYPDGIFWLPFGQQPNLAQLQRNVAKALGDQGAFENEEQGKAKLRELLVGKAVLLICDDVWEAHHATAFDVLGPRCRALITTRDAELLHALKAQEFPVQLLTDDEALALLAKASGTDRAALPAEAREVARECDHLPLALALCGGMAFGPEGIGWADILGALRNADLPEIATDHPFAQQHGSLWKAITLSVRRLTPDEQRRWAELSVFPEDETVPEAAVRTLWTHTGAMSSIAIGNLLKRLANRSLLYLHSDKGDNSVHRALRVSLHDLLHDYAKRAAGEPRALHQSLLDAYRAKCPDGWASGPDDGYFFQQMRHHLIVLERWDELCAYLTDFRCLDRRIRAGQVFGVVTDHRAAIAALPEFAEEAARERERVRICAEYGAGLIAYARDSAAGKKPQLPQPPATGNAAATGELPEERSPRAARLRAIANFTGQQVSLLAAFPWDFLPLAANAAADGPLSEAERLADATGRPWLHRSPIRPTPPRRPQCLLTLHGHTDTVWSVTVTPDGRLAVSGSDDKTLRLWDLKSGQCLRTLQGHTGNVNSVGVTPDGRLAVSASDDDTLRLWNLDSGQCIQRLHGHTRKVNSVSVTPDGRRAISGSDDNTLRVWDLDSGQCIHTLQGHTGWISSVSVTPDGRRAVSGSGDKTLRVWDLDSAQCIHTLQGDTNSVTSVSITPDGRRAMSASVCEVLRLWDLDSGHCLQILRARSGYNSYNSAVSMTPAGRLAVSATSRSSLGACTIQVWNLDNGQCLQTLQGHSGSVKSVSITPDFRLAVSASDDRTLRVWDLGSGQCIPGTQEHTGEVQSVSVTRDGRRVVSASWDNTLRVWDLHSGQCRQTLQGHTTWVNRVSVTPDGRRAVSASSDKTLRVWDLDSGKCLWTLRGHTDAVWSVSVTTDGRRAVSGSGDKTVRVWDLDSGQCIHTLQGHTGWVSTVIVTTDGWRAVSGSGDKTLRVWDLDSGEGLHTLQGHTDYVDSVSVTPDGRRAVSASKDKTVRVWDLKSGQCLHTLQGHTDYVESVSVTPDGRHAVSASSDHTLRVWDLDSGQCLQILEGHTSYVFRVSVTPDGRRAVSASNDSTLRVWDIASGRCVAIYHARAIVQSIAVSPIGDRILCGTEEGQMHFLTMRNFA